MRMTERIRSTETVRRRRTETGRRRGTYLYTVCTFIFLFVKGLLKELGRRIYCKISQG